MRSIHRTALLRSTLDDNNHDDDDPSPAGGAMPVPAILSANDNATVEPLRLVPSVVPVHPALATIITWSREDVAHAVERLRGGGVPNPIETVDGKIVNLEGAIEAEALAQLGRKIQPIENTTVKTDVDVRDHVLRLLPVQVSEITRAVACVLSTTSDERQAFSRSLMSKAGKKGAAIRHRKGRKGPELASNPHKSGYPAWVAHFAALARCKPYTIREVFKFADKTPDVFDMLKPDAVMPHKLTHLGDARALAGRFPGNTKAAIKTRHDCVAYWRDKDNGRGGPEAGVKLTETFAFFSRRLRESLGGHTVTTKNIVRGDNYTLYLGTMEKCGRSVEDNSIDVVFADIVYGKVEMAREVANLAVRVLRPGGFLVIVNGNFTNLPVLNVVAENKGLIERPTLHVRYLHAKGGMAKMGIRHIDACPYFVWSKGEIEHAIDHLAYVSDTAPGKVTNMGGGEGVHHLWQKNPRVLSEIFKALTPSAKGAGVPRILDCCMGWGTSGVACRKLGWEFVGIEPENDPDAQGGPRFSIAAEDVKSYEAAWARSVGKSGESKKGR